MKNPALVSNTAGDLGCGALRLRAAAFALCLMYGGNVVAMRLALADLPPLLTASLRAGLTVLAVLLWVGVTANSLRVPVRQVVPLMVMSVITVGCLCMPYLALTYTTTTHVAVLLYVYPILTALFAHTLLPGERLSRRSSIGLALGFGGAALTVSAYSPHTRSASILGDALALLSAALLAAQAILYKRLSLRISPASQLFYPAAVSATALAVASLRFEPGVAGPLRWVTVAAVLYQGFVVSTLGTFAWVLLSQRFAASLLTAYMFLTPVFGLLGSIVVLGESVSTRLFMGLLMVGLGLLLIDLGTPALTARFWRVRP